MKTHFFVWQKLSRFNFANQRFIQLFSLQTKNLPKSKQPLFLIAKSEAEIKRKSITYEKKMAQRSQKETNSFINWCCGVNIRRNHKRMAQKSAEEKEKTELRATLERNSLAYLFIVKLRFYHGCLAFINFVKVVYFLVVSYDQIHTCDFRTASPATPNHIHVYLKRKLYIKSHQYGSCCVFIIWSLSFVLFQVFDAVYVILCIEYTRVSLESIRFSEGAKRVTRLGDAKCDEK